MGRPRKEVDFRMLDELCQIHCTAEEICAILDLDMETLNKRIREQTGRTFKAYFDRASAGGRASLRRKQFEMALDGDRMLLMWLGKQVLNQSEKSESQTQNLTAQKLVIEIKGDNHQANEVLTHELTKRLEGLINGNVDPASLAEGLPGVQITTIPKEALQSPDGSDSESEDC